MSLPPTVNMENEVLIASFVVSSGLAVFGMTVGGGIGWCLTLPMVGMCASRWPRWAAFFPLLGLLWSAALDAAARYLHAPPAPLALTLTTYLLLAYCLVLAFQPGVHLRRQLEATAARVEVEQGVLEVMARLAQLAARPDLHLPEVARLALHLARAVLPLTGAAIVTGRPAGALHSEQLFSGEDGATFSPFGLLGAPSPAFWEAHLAQTDTFFNQAAWSMVDHAWRGAIAVLPLHLPGETPVSLVVRRTGIGASWGLHDRQLLQATAQSLRLVADQQRQLRALEHHAHHDALTGCLNRHAFTLHLQRLQSIGAGYTMALTDLNGFKALNDQEGHARGDEALRQFADALHLAFPAPETVYRLGGDEFALLLRDQWADQSTPAPEDGLERMIQAVVRIPGQLRQMGLNLAGVSIGTAHSSEANGAEAVLSLADHRMYCMKPHRTSRRASLDNAASTGAERLAPLEQALHLLGVVLEARDVETHKHSVRVVEWAIRLGQRLNLDPAALSALKQGAYLHDLGKLVVPDRVLLKPGPLNAEEWALMQTHAEAGHRLASTLGFLDPQALAVIRSHHERWDGQGYPDRLVGTSIPILARIYAVVDVFDALTSRRPYKAAWPVEQALAELELQAGRQFDPDVVKAFLLLWFEQPQPGEQERQRADPYGPFLH